MTVATGIIFTITAVILLACIVSEISNMLCDLKAEENKESLRKVVIEPKAQSLEETREELWETYNNLESLWC